MAARRTRITFPIKILNIFHSKNTLFHLFIFLIGLPIGFICSFYLQSFSTAIQTSIFNVLHSLLLPSSPPLPHVDNLSLLTPPPLPQADNLSSLTPPLPNANNLSSLAKPTPPLLPNADNLSSSTPPPLPQGGNLSSLTQPPPPLLDADNLSSLATPTPPPLLLNAQNLSSLTTPLLLLNADNISSLAPPPLPQADNLSSLTQPPLPLPNAYNIPSLTTPPLLSTADNLSSLTTITPPPLLPNADNLSSLTPPDTLSLSPSSQPPSAPPPLLSESIPPTTPPLILSPPRVSVAEKIPMTHNMSDEDLVKNVMEVSMMTTTNNYKVAFMFLTPGPLPLSPLWELFFKGHEGLFSIYVHPHPSYNDTIPQDSVFYGTRITSQPVYWGDISMIDAERRLLANALLDPSNQRFVLLSDSCIPLFNFTTTYNYLVNSNLSYVSSFDDKRKSGRGRYNPQMAPNITIQDWRKGSQWFEVNRDLALAIVAEQNYYSLFKEYCHPPCYNDEHYLPTLVNILYRRLNSNRTITYVDWSIVGPHPRKFGGGEITEELLNSIRFGSTECVYNDNTAPMCVLFARKFAPSTLNPLLTFSPLLFGTNT